MARSRPTRGELYVVFLLMCVLFAAILTLGIGAKQRSDANGQRISNNELATCQQLTTVQITANRSHAADWVVFKTVLDQSKAAASGQLTPVEQVFLGRLTAAVAEKSWVPIVNCVERARRDGSFVPPRAVAFNTGQPPPSAVRAP